MASVYSGSIFRGCHPVLAGLVDRDRRGRVGWLELLAIALKGKLGRMKNQSMKDFLGASIFLLALCGCAERGALLPNATHLQPALNLYNRNFIVAGPTELGNVACAVPPLFLVELPIAYLHEKITHKTHSGFPLSEFASATCGFVTGTPFIPFSFLCPENPWYGKSKSQHHPWRCEKFTYEPPSKKENPVNPIRSLSVNPS